MVVIDTFYRKSLVVLLVTWMREDLISQYMRSSLHLKVFKNLQTIKRCRVDITGIPYGMSLWAYIHPACISQSYPAHQLKRKNVLFPPSPAKQSVCSHAWQQSCSSSMKSHHCPSKGCPDMAMPNLRPLVCQAASPPFQPSCKHLGIASVIWGAGLECFTVSNCPYCCLVLCSPP